MVLALEFILKFCSNVRISNFRFGNCICEFFIQPFGSTGYETLTSPYLVNDLLNDLNSNLANRDAFSSLIANRRPTFISF